MADDYQPAIRSVDDVPADNRRGGDVRTLLSPKTVGSTSGVMGVATIAPGDWIAEHYHPYSEEFIYVASGSLVAELDGERHERAGADGALHPDQRPAPPPNEGDEDALIVFHLGPLAPRPPTGARRHGTASARGCGTPRSRALRRSAVTGIGVVAPGGVTRDAFWEIDHRRPDGDPEDHVLRPVRVPLADRGRGRLRPARRRA